MDPLKIEGRPLNTHKDVRFFDYSSYIASCGKLRLMIKFINLLFSFLDWHLILLAQPPPPPSPTYKPTKIQIHPSITVDQDSSWLAWPIPAKDDAFSSSVIYLSLSQYARKNTFRWSSPARLIANDGLEKYNRLKEAEASSGHCYHHHPVALLIRIRGGWHLKM